jgi:hypothetical protein
MTLSTKFNFKFAILPKFHQRKLHLTRHLFNKINEERKIEERINSTSEHQTTFRNLLKGNIQYRENIKSSLTTYQFTSKIKCQNVFIDRRSNFTTMQQQINMT